MRRTIFSFMAAMALTAFCLNAISVYVFHDVDKDLVGRWNEAYIELCLEFAIFTVVVGGAVWPLTLLGRRLFRLQSVSPRPNFVRFLGVGVILLQYPVEFAARVLLPRFSDLSLSLYIVASIAASAALLLRDNFKQLQPRA